MWVRGGSRMVFLSTVEFYFFLHRGGARHFGGGRLSLYAQLVSSVASAYRQHSARYTAADPLLFADMYGRTVKKKADVHGYISASTG